jgi:hypothetical protein
VPFASFVCCLAPRRTSILPSKHGEADHANRHMRDARVASMGGLYDTALLHEILLHLRWGKKTR